MKRAVSLAMVFGAAVACGVEPKQGAATGTAAETGAPVQAQQSQAAGGAQPATAAAQRDAGDEPAAFAVASMAKLPACDDAREGAVVYARSERRLLACASRQWTDAPVESGADGLPGKDGVAGAAGRDGKNGRDGKDGRDGRGAGLETEELAPGAECAAGGVAVTPYADDDGDGKRGEAEAAGETRVLCDGAAGAAGAAGRDGNDGAAGAAGAAGAKGDDGAAGAQGQQGAQGPQGQAGANGANGTDNHIVARYVCTGAVYSSHMSAGAPANLSAVYKAYLYASGDVRASASVYWDDAAGQPAGYSQRFSEEYAAGDGAAATAVVSGKQNWVTGSTTGVWTWTLDRVSSSVAVRYDDADMSPTWTTFSHACTRTTY